MKYLTLVISSFLISFTAFSQTITPDMAFGNNGVVVTAENGKSTVINDIALQNDGRIVAAGESYDSLERHTYIARYLPNGVIDNSFGVNGRVSIAIGWADGLKAVRIQPDGKIIAVGNQTIITPDPVNPPPAVIITTKPFAIRYRPNGTLDSAFANNGIHHLDILDAFVNRSMAALVLLPGGKIVLAGNARTSNAGQMLLVCLRADGAYETAFGNGGMALYTVEPGKDATLYDMNIQQDGKLLLAGSSGLASLSAPPDTRMALVRVDQNGSLDPGFANSGVLALQIPSGNPNPYDVATSVKIQQNGKIVAAGGTSNLLAIVRFNADGSLDQSFGQAGIAYDISRPAADDLQLLADGRLMISALKANTNPYSTDITLSRFTTAGIPDSSFGTNADMLIDQSDRDRSYALTIQPDNKILLAGHATHAPSGKVSFALWRFTNTVASVPQQMLQKTSVYPNPGSEVITMDFHKIPEAAVTVKLFDITGKNILTTATQLQSFVLNIAHLANGIYTLQLSSKECLQTFKLTKN